jgi:hypothetical protein
MRLAPIDTSSWLAPTALAAQLRAGVGQSIGGGFARGAAAVGGAMVHRADEERQDARIAEQQRIQQEQFGATMGQRQEEQADMLNQKTFDNAVTSRTLLDVTQRRNAKQAAQLQLMPGYEDSQAWRDNQAERVKIQSSIGSQEAVIFNHKVRQAATGRAMPGGPGAPAAPATWGEGYQDATIDPWKENQAREDASWATLRDARNAQVAPEVAPALPGAVAPADSARGPDTSGLDPEEAALVNEEASLLADKLKTQQMMKALEGIREGGGVVEVPWVKQADRMTQDVGVREIALKARRAAADENRYVRKATEVAEQNKEREIGVNLDQALGALESHAPEVVGLMRERAEGGLETKAALLGKAKEMLSVIDKDAQNIATEKRQAKVRALEQKNRLEMARIGQENRLTAQAFRYDLYHQNADAADVVKLQDMAVKHMVYERTRLMDKLDPRDFPPGEDLEAYVKQQEIYKTRVEALDSQILDAEREKLRLSGLPKEERPSVRAYLDSIGRDSEDAPVGSPTSDSFWQKTESAPGKVFPVYAPISNTASFNDIDRTVREAAKSAGGKTREKDIQATVVAMWKRAKEQGQEPGLR